MARRSRYIFVSSAINYVASVMEMDSEVYPSTMMSVPVVYVAASLAR